MDSQFIQSSKKITQNTISVFMIISATLQILISNVSISNIDTDLDAQQGNIDSILCTPLAYPICINVAIFLTIDSNLFKFNLYDLLFTRICISRVSLKTVKFSHEFFHQDHIVVTTGYFHLLKMPCHDNYTALSQYSESYGTNDSEITF